MMHIYFLHLRGTDVNGVEKTYQYVHTQEGNLFDKELEKFNKKFDLVESTVVYFRNMGEVKPLTENLEGDSNEKDSNKKSDSEEIANEKSGSKKDRQKDSQ